MTHFGDSGPALGLIAAGLCWMFAAVAVCADLPATRADAEASKLVVYAPAGWPASLPVGSVVAAGDRLRASTALEVLDATPGGPVAGLMVSASGEGPVSDGTMFFGADRYVAYARRFEQGVWKPIGEGRFPVHRAARAHLEVTRARGEFRFVLNGRQVTMWAAPEKAVSVWLHVAGGSTAAFYDWQVSCSEVFIGPLGLDLRTLDGAKRGVLVAKVDADGVAPRAGLQVGDFVLAVQGDPVACALEVLASVDLARLAANRERDGPTVPLTFEVRRGRHTFDQTVPVELPPVISPAPPAPPPPV